MRFRSICNIWRHHSTSYTTVTGEKKLNYLGTVAREKALLMPFFLRISFICYNLKATNIIIQDINLYCKKVAHTKYSSNIPSTVKYGYVFIEKLSFLPQNISVAKVMYIWKKWSRSLSFLRDIGILCPCGRDCPEFPNKVLLPKGTGYVALWEKCCID